MSKTALALFALVSHWCQRQRQHYRHVSGWEDVQ